MSDDDDGMMMNFTVGGGEDAGGRKRKAKRHLSAQDKYKRRMAAREKTATRAEAHAANPDAAAMRGLLTGAWKKDKGPRDPQGPDAAAVGGGGGGGGRGAAPSARGGRGGRGLGAARGGGRAGGRGGRGGPGGSGDSSGAGRGGDDSAAGIIYARFDPTSAASHAAAAALPRKTAAAGPFPRGQSHPRGGFGAGRGGGGRSEAKAKKEQAPGWRDKATPAPRAPAVPAPRRAVGGYDSDASDGAPGFTGGHVRGGDNDDYNWAAAEATMAGDESDGDGGDGGGGDDSDGGYESGDRGSPPPQPAPLPAKPAKKSKKVTPKYAPGEAPWEQISDGEGGGAEEGGEEAVVDFLDGDAAAGAAGPAPAPAPRKKAAEPSGGGGSDSEGEGSYEELWKNRLPAPGGKAKGKTKSAKTVKKLQVGSHGPALIGSAAAEYFGDGGGAGEGVDGADLDTFQGLGLSESLERHLGTSLGFERPTRVQQGGIPPMVRGRDALVQAATGSGKTLTYLAPIVNDLAGAQPRVGRGDGTYALILAPTRELCIQINEVLQQLLKRYVWVVGGVVFGGENRAHEKARLRKGISVLVATPGRLLDHIKMTASFKVERLRWLVLDEADRLLDLGFEEDLNKILSVCAQRRDPRGPRRQTALLSATVTTQLGRLASVSLEDPVAVGFRANVAEDGTVELDGAADGDLRKEAERFTLPSQLKQGYVLVPSRARLVTLTALLRGYAKRDSKCKIVVFMSSCDGVEFHYKALIQYLLGDGGEPLVPCKVFKLHGNMEQMERTSSFLSFSQAEQGILVCSDVAARGLDFPGVSTIVQFDPPGEPAEYVHRVGRTARMGREGDSVLFLLPHEREYIGLLDQKGVVVKGMPLLRILDDLPDPNLRYRPGAARKRDFRAGDDDDGGDMDSKAEQHVAAVEAGLAVERLVANDKKAQKLAADAFRSYVRAMAAYPKAIKHIFHVKKLHLGHVARSFALRDPPTMIGQSSSKKHKQDKMALKKGGLGGKGGKLHGLGKKVRDGQRVKGTEQKRMLTKARQLEREQGRVGGAGGGKSRAGGGGHYNTE